VYRANPTLLMLQVAQLRAFMPQLLGVLYGKSGMFGMFFERGLSAENSSCQVVLKCLEKSFYCWTLALPSSVTDRPVAS
jgi:hypothetical protein